MYYKKAENEGTYTDFTGTILWDGTSCKVKNATFELRNIGRYRIKFDIGSIVGGTIRDAEIHQCNKCYNTNIEGCMWLNGSFQGKNFTNSTWNYGIFAGGYFRSSNWWGGVWHRGRWISGYDKNKIFYPRGKNPNTWDEIREKKQGKANEPGEWKDYTGEIAYGETDCVVRRASFEIYPITNEKQIKFSGGEVVEGYVGRAVLDNVLFNGEKATNCQWKSGDFHGDVFENGKFEGGTFNGSFFIDGVFVNGTWNGGYWDGRFWISGFDKFGEKQGYGYNPNEVDDSEEWNKLKESYEEEKKKREEEQEKENQRKTRKKVTIKQKDEDESSKQKDKDDTNKQDSENKEKQTKEQSEYDNLLDLYEGL